MPTEPGRAAATVQDRTVPHGTMDVDLDAVVANWRAIGRVAAPARAAAVLKADGYGLGAALLAQALAAAGCTQMFVALTEEALALRPLLPRTELFVLNGLPAGEEDLYIAHGLTPVLNTTEELKRWQGTAARLARPVPCALHLDTGMHRLGLPPAKGRALGRSWTRLEGMDIRLVMSHLACADDPAHPQNAAQLGLFKDLRRGLPAVPASLAATYGTYLGPGYHFDLVRPGIGLSGSTPNPGRHNPLTPAVRVRARILSVRRVDPPGAVGYGATHTVTGSRDIATVSIGYADGLIRALGNVGYGGLAGRKVPMVGRISMDLTTFDVTEVGADTVRPGDMIDLIGGDGPDVDTVAAAAGTIAYELLTGLALRLPRRYVGAAQMRGGAA